MTEEARPLTHADVERIVQLAEEGDFGYVRLEAEGLRVTLVREGAAVPDEDVATAPGAVETRPGAVAASRPAGAESAESPGAPPAAPRDEPSPAPQDRAATPDASASGDAAEGVLVTSPVVGIIYLAPDPDSPPYVTQGETVEPDTTLGLIEVMKMFTAVKAACIGRVAELLVTNAEHVEQGQPLFRIVQD